MRTRIGPVSGHGSAASALCRDGGGYSLAGMRKRRPEGIANCFEVDTPVCRDRIVEELVVANLRP